MKKIERIINNAQRYGADTKIGKWIFHYSPATGEVIRTPAKGGAEKVVARA